MTKNCMWRMIIIGIILLFAALSAAAASGDGTSSACPLDTAMLLLGGNLKTDRIEPRRTPWPQEVNHALTIIESALDDPDVRARALRLKGIALMYLDRKKEACGILLQATDEYPNDAKLLLALSSCQSSLGHDQEARATLLRILKTDPKNAEALLGLAFLYNTSQPPNPDKADDLATQALTHDPTLARAYFMLGVNDAHRNRYDAAIRHFRAGVTIDPGCLWAWNTMAWYLERQGKIEEANQVRAEAYGSVQVSASQ